MTICWGVHSRPQCLMMHENRLSAFSGLSEPVHTDAKHRKELVKLV